MEKEELIMYLAAVREAVSAVLMTKREAKQMPVYFVSRTLQGPEINYTSMEKLVVALVHASKRLKRYFQDHTIIIITYQPIKQILPRPEVVGRLQKWSIELVERPEDDSLDTPMEAEEELSDPWTLFTDGSSCIDGSGSGLVNGSYIAKEHGMIQYLEKVKVLSSTFKKFSIEQVPRSENKKADALMLVVVEEEGDTWMTPIYNYLTEETLLEEKEKARAVRRKSGSMHARTRSVVAKAIRTGYYWPTMHADARKLIRACQDCQPFYKWGIDIAGPFPEGPGKVKFLIVEMDYFTKWIEAKRVTTIAETTHSKTGAKSYASANALLPSSIHKPMA
ncbi:reverse transcriptase domain-containing protein [Tanacetum coccineum]